MDQLTKAGHVNSFSGIFRIFAQPDWNQTWGFKGGDEGVHEVVVTGPVAGVVGGGVDPAGLAGVPLHEHALPHLDHIVPLPGQPYDGQGSQVTQAYCIVANILKIEIGLKKTYPNLPEQCRGRRSRTCGT